MEAWRRGDKNAHGSNEGFHFTSSYLNWFDMKEIKLDIKDLAGVSLCFFWTIFWKIHRLRCSLEKALMNTLCLPISNRHLVMKARWRNDMVGMLLCSCCLVDLVLFWQAALWTCLAQRLHGHNKQSQSCWWVLRRGLETPQAFPVSASRGSRHCYRLNTKTPLFFESAIPSNFVFHVSIDRLAFADVNGVTSVTSSIPREDFFKGSKSSAEYLAASKGYVPPNSRTAILYVTRPKEQDGFPILVFATSRWIVVVPDRSKVRQMQHMPQKALLQLAWNSVLNIKGFGSCWRSLHVGLYNLYGLQHMKALFYV